MDCVLPIGFLGLGEWPSQVSTEDILAVEGRAGFLVLGESQSKGAENSDALLCGPAIAGGFIQRMRLRRQYAVPRPAFSAY